MKAAMFVAVAAAILGGLFLFFRPAPIAQEPRAISAPAPVPVNPAVIGPAAIGSAAIGEIPAAEREPDPLTFEWVVQGGRLVSGPRVVKARKDDEITLVITSDAADEVHVHGYDRHATLKPGETATIRIKASRTGRFPFELHKSRLELGTLEIYPR